MDLPSGNVVDRSQPCAACGYDLRGLPISGTCPECGLEIALSLEEPLLQYADPSWVQGLAKGVTLILVSLLVGICMGVVVGAMTPAFSGGSGAMIGQSVLGLIPSLLYLAGIWLLTQPDPGHGAIPDPKSRTLTRHAAVTALVVSLVAIGVSAVHLLAGGIFDFISGVADLVAFFAAFVYIRQLAQRVPDPKLAASTRTAMWGIVCSYGVIIAGGIVMLILVSTNPSGPSSSAFGIAGVPMCLGGVGVLVFAIWTIVLLFMYRSRFTDAANKAERFRRQGAEAALESDEF